MLIEYLEGVYNTVLQQLETLSNKRLTRFVDENINALKNKSFKISQHLFEDLRKAYTPLPSIFNPLKDFIKNENATIKNENVTANTETNFKTYLFNLASESDKLFFVNEQNLFDLIIHLYFKEKHLQWLIEVMDFVREDEKEVNENDKLRLWIDGVESKGNKFVDEPILSTTKMNLKKGAKVDLIRVIVAMYDNGFFEGETKQKVDLINVMNTLGDVLGVDLSDYDNSLSTGFLSKIETNLKVFDTLKQAIQKRYNKRLEK